MDNLKKSLVKCIYKQILLIFLILITSYSCSVPKILKPSKVETSAPVNAKEKARRNVDEGRGVSLQKAFGGSKSTTYEFSTSNPLWRASLELIDFMPLTTVDYSGGIIITDWYNDSVNDEESLKITIRFLSNEILSNSLKIIVHKKNCKVIENCAIKEVKSKISFELQKSILAKASELEKQAKEKK